MQKNLNSNKYELRKEIVVLMSKGEYTFALKKARELVKVTKLLFVEEPFKYFYSYIADSLLLVKSFIRLDKLESAEQCLLQVWVIIDNFYLKSKNFSIEKFDFNEIETFKASDVSKKLSKRHFSQFNANSFNIDANSNKQNFVKDVKTFFNF